MKEIFPHRLRSAFARPLIPFTMLLLTACGEPGPDDEILGELSSALSCPGNPNNGDCPWKTVHLLEPNPASNDIVHEQAPTLCGGEGNGFFAISVQASTHRYRTLQWNLATTSPSWGSFGTKAFASKAGCSFREDGDSNGNPGFVIAGKATDGKIYAAPGTLAPGAVPQGTPVANAPFAQVGTHTYNSSATSPAGAPTLATGGNKMVMVLLGNDARTIYAHVRAIPYVSASSSWSGRITGPVLPSGWTALGPPAMVVHPVTFYIVVSARNGGQDRLFATHFYGPGQHFSSGTGSPPATWQQLAQLGPISTGGPSLTYSPLGTTYWYRLGGEIRETTAPVATNPLLPVAPSKGHIFASDPSASWGWGTDSQGGLYHVLARTTSNKLVMANSNMDSNLAP